MIEIIKAIVEPIAKAVSIPDLIKNHKDKKAHDIGTELFVIYASLNGILVVGRSIVSELERGSEWMQRKLAEGKPDQCLATHLDFLLKQQSTNILKLVASVKRLGLEMQVIAPDVYVRLAPLIHGKLSAVRCLLERIDGKYSKPRLVSVTPESIDSLIELGSKYSAGLTTADAKSRAHMVAMHMVREEEHAFQHLVREEEIDNIGSIPAHQYPIIRAYLDNRRPASTLDEIEALLLVFRQSIEANFSLREILLSVGDHRASLTDQFVGF